MLRREKGENEPTWRDGRKVERRREMRRGRERSVVRRSRSEDREPTRIAGVGPGLGSAARGGTETFTPAPFPRAPGGPRPP